MADLKTTDLKTNYKDDVLNTEVNERRKYQMIQNDDGTVSFVDVTDYSQVGDSFGALDINATNEKIKEINSNLANFTDNKLYDGHVNNIIENSIKYCIGAQGLPANANTYGLIVTLVSSKTGTTVQNAKQLYFPYSDITGYYIRSCVDGNWYPWYRINGVAI